MCFTSQRYLEHQGCKRPTRWESMLCSACVHDTIYFNTWCRKIDLISVASSILGQLRKDLPLVPFCPPSSCQVGQPNRDAIWVIESEDRRGRPLESSHGRKRFSGGGEGENRTGMATDGRRSDAHDGRFLKRGAPISYALYPLSWKLSLIRLFITPFYVSIQISVVKSAITYQRNSS